MENIALPTTLKLQTSSRSSIQLINAEAATVNGGAKLVHPGGAKLVHLTLCGTRWTLLTKVETSCDRILIAGGANVEAEWEQGPAV